jgi:hypothetical protein
LNSGGGVLNAKTPKLVERLKETERMISRSLAISVCTVLAAAAVLFAARPAASHDSFANGLEVQEGNRIALVEVHANVTAGDGIRQRNAPVAVSSFHISSITPYTGPITVNGFYMLEFGDEGPSPQLWTLDSSDRTPRSDQRTLGWPTVVPEGLTVTEASTTSAHAIVTDRHFLVGKDIAVQQHQITGF